MAAHTLPLPAPTCRANLAMRRGVERIECLECGYDLRGQRREVSVLPVVERRETEADSFICCPECGRLFNPADRSTVRVVYSRPVRWRRRLGIALQLCGWGAALLSIFAIISIPTGFLALLSASISGGWVFALSLVPLLLLPLSLCLDDWGRALRSIGG